MADFLFPSELVAKQGFARVSVCYTDITSDDDFTELLAPGIEGINGLTISNAIHLSSWKGEMVDSNNFPDDEFYEMLQEKIKNSKVDKSHIKNKVNSVAGTF